MDNEETIYEGGGQRLTSQNVPQGRTGSKSWKKVVIGGTTGILMGAGGAIAALAYASHADGETGDSRPVADDDVISKDWLGEDYVAESESSAELDSGEEMEVISDGLNVAFVEDDLSFGEAFAEARSQVGPGGVFEWRGALFNTYYAEEWDAMTDEQKSDFAQQVNMAVGTDADNFDYDSWYAEVEDYESPSVDSGDNDDEPVVIDASDAVQILGLDEYNGHDVVLVDMNQDNKPDFAVIDMDDDYELSPNDMIVTSEGDSFRVGNLIGGNNDMDHFAHNPGVADNFLSDVDDGLNEI